MLSALYNVWMNVAMHVQVAVYSQMVCHLSLNHFKMLDRLPVQDQ